MKPCCLRRLTVALGVALFLSACRHASSPPPAAEPPVAPVRVLRVEPVTRVATEEVVGTVRPRTRATLEAKVTGRVDQLLVVPGQRVRQGEELARLDAREIQARLDQALAVRAQASRERQRFAELLRQKAVSQQEYDAVEARARVAEATVNEAQTMLDYTRVTAPFDGVITRKLADVGDLLTPGKPLLEMEGISGFRVEADVPEALIENVAMGMKIPVRIEASGTDMEGVVSEIAPAASAGSRTFLVKIDLPDVSGLRAGRFARVAVPVAEQKVLRVPASAVVLRGQLELLFVVRDRRASLRIVKTGKRLGDAVEILAGLEAGEDVVVTGMEQLTDGQPVVIGQ